MKTFKKPVLATIKSAIAELYTSRHITELMNSYGFSIKAQDRYSNKLAYVDAFLDHQDFSAPNLANALLEMLNQIFLENGHLITLGQNDQSSKSIHEMTKLYKALKSMGLHWHENAFSEQKNDSPLKADLDRIWKPNLIRMFISHRSSRKVEASNLANILKDIGISGFVAHEDIEGTQKWKNEILNALETMDCFLSLLSKDYYSSEWTNQEIGFAVAKKTPMFIYSLDKTIPIGFQMDDQAILKGENELIRIIIKRFENHSPVRNGIINSFCKGIDGSFAQSKTLFSYLADLTLSDPDIEKIVGAFQAKTKYANQHLCLFEDKITVEHKKNRSLSKFSTYCEALQELVLNQHSMKNYKVEKKAGKTYQIIEDRIII